MSHSHSRYRLFFFLSMDRRPPRSTRTDTPVPDTTLFRATEAQPPTRLRLQSNLVGTRLTLPEPLDKPAAAALPTTVETTLPLGAGDIEVAFGKRLALRPRSAGARDRTSVVQGKSVSVCGSRWSPYNKKKNTHK